MQASDSEVNNELEADEKEGVQKTGKVGHVRTVRFA
jgi:hypothetical protein